MSWRRHSGETPYSLGAVDGITAPHIGVYRRYFIDLIDDLNNHDEQFCASERCRGNTDAWRYTADPDLTVDWKMWHSEGDVNLIKKTK